MVLDTVSGNEWKVELGNYISVQEGEIHLVGAGNPLRGDDAVGLRIIDGLGKRYGKHPPPRVVLHQESSSIESVISRIDISRSGLVIFDAVQSGRAPGSIICASLADSRYGFFATHNIPLKLIPSVASNPDAVRVVGVQPEVMDVGERLSDVVKSSAEEVVEYAAKLLEAV